MQSDRIYLNLPALDRLRLARGLSKLGLARESALSSAVVTRLYAQGYASPLIYGRLLAFFGLTPEEGERLLIVGIRSSEKAVAAS